MSGTGSDKLDTRHARQYRLLLQDLSAKLGAETPEQRQAVYARARRSNERLIETHRERLSDSIIADMRDSLEAVIDEFEAAASAPVEAAVEQDPAGFADAPENDFAPARQVMHEPEDRAADMSRSGLMSSNFALGAAAGAAATALLLLLGTLFGLVSLGSGGGPYASEFERRMEEARPGFETTVAFMHRLETAIKARLASDPAGLEKAAGKKLVKLSEALPEFAEAAKTLPKGTQIHVRANTRGYKIRAMYNDCAYARFFAPQYIDAKTDYGFVGCIFLSVSDDGGKDY